MQTPGFGLNGVILFQLIFFSLSVGYLSDSLGKQFGVPVSAAISAMIVINPFAIYHYSILTESLTYSLLIVIISLCIHCIFRTRKIKHLAIISICIGIAISIRPAAWGFALLLPMLLVYLWGTNSRSRLRWSAAAFAPLVSIAIASSVRLPCERQRTNDTGSVSFLRKILFSFRRTPAIRSQLLWSVGCGAPQRQKVLHLRTIPR